MNVLVINAGSSSLKFQLFNMETETVIAKGNCDRIGIDGHLKYKPVSNGKPVFDEDIPLPTHAEAIAATLKKIVSEEYGVLESLTEINAVGHRVLHGGRNFSQSVLINDEVIAAIESCIPLGPLHIPANLMGIRACEAAMPGTPQVAVFDSAFHQTMPEHAYTYSIPYEYYEKNDIRRYGYHGTSHRYVSALAIEELGIPVEGSKIVTCHLGNGASIAAVKDGKSIETSMGLTPLEGLSMGTRSGSVDPALFSVISKLNGLSVDETLDLLNKESGVLGVSGLSSDFRDVESAAGYDIGTGDLVPGKEINERCSLALEIFCHNVVKYIGSYYAIMGGMDALVFTAGVGENSPLTRRRVCQMLEGFGIRFDYEKNKFRGLGKFVDITGPDSIAKVYVIPTDEELVIARDTKELV